MVRGPERVVPEEVEMLGLKGRADSQQEEDAAMAMRQDDESATLIEEKGRQVSVWRRQSSRSVSGDGEQLPIWEKREDAATCASASEHFSTSTIDLNVESEENGHDKEFVANCAGEESDELVHVAIDDEATKIWEKVLPVDYIDICRAVFPNPLPFDDRREVYSQLEAGVLLHGGLYSYRLMKRQGSDRVSSALAISASAMAIVWGHDRRHWQEVSSSSSVFGRVMYLHQVNWFDISGSFSWQLAPGTYTCAWRLSRKPHENFLDDVATFWSHYPAESIVRTNDGQIIRLSLPLSDQTVVQQPEWMEWQAGEFVVPEIEGSNLTNVEIEFMLRETNFESVKMGLCVDCFRIYESDPDNNNNNNNNINNNDSKIRPAGRRVRDGSSAVFVEEERPDAGRLMWRSAAERIVAALRYVADPLNSTGLAES